MNSIYLPRQGQWEMRRLSFKTEGRVHMFTARRWLSSVCVCVCVCVFVRVFLPATSLNNLNFQCALPWSSTLTYPHHQTHWSTRSPFPTPEPSSAHPTQPQTSHRYHCLHSFLTAHQPSLPYISPLLPTASTLPPPHTHTTRTAPSPLTLSTHPFLPEKQVRPDGSSLL